jgi:hypothetical protein
MRQVGGLPPWLATEWMDRPRRTFIRIDAPTKEMTAFIRRI